VTDSVYLCLVRDNPEMLRFSLGVGSYQGLLKNVFITKKTLSGLANEVGGSAIRAGSVGWLGGWVVGWLGRCVMGLGNAFRA